MVAVTVEWTSSHKIGITNHYREKKINGLDQNFFQQQPEYQ